MIRRLFQLLNRRVKDDGLNHTMSWDWWNRMDVRLFLRQDQLIIAVVMLCWAVACVQLQRLLLYVLMDPCQCKVVVQNRRCHGHSLQQHFAFRFPPILMRCGDPHKLLPYLLQRRGLINIWINECISLKAFLNQCICHTTDIKGKIQTLQRMVGPWNPHGELNWCLNYILR